MSTINGLGSSMGMMMSALAMQKTHQQQMFSKVDADASGTVDQSELTSFAEGLNEKTGIAINAEEALSTYDADGDGALSQEELEAMMEAYMPPPPMMSGAGQAGGGGGMGPGAMGPPPDKEEMFATIDTDASGTVDESELASFVEELAQNTGTEIDPEEALSTYDADGDGALSQEELDTMMAANRPSPPSPSQVIEAYNQNSGAIDDEMLSQLLSLFGDAEDDSQGFSYMPFNAKV